MESTNYKFTNLSMIFRFYVKVSKSQSLCSEWSGGGRVRATSVTSSYLACMSEIDWWENYHQVILYQRQFICMVTLSCRWTERFIDYKVITENAKASCRIIDLHL